MVQKPIASSWLRGLAGLSLADFGRIDKLKYCSPLLSVRI
jgi:hypothetical protein